MSEKPTVHWLLAPEDHDYPAAESYLELLFEAETALGFVSRLREAPVSQFKAKDIFRASGLPLLDVSNSHVRKDRNKIEAGTKISPLLLLRATDASRLIIADGYHRLCAVYSVDEDALIPCKIV